MSVHNVVHVDTVCWQCTSKVSLRSSHFISSLANMVHSAHRRVCIAFANFTISIYFRHSNRESSWCDSRSMFPVDLMTDDNRCKMCTHFSCYLLNRIFLVHISGLYWRISLLFSCCVWCIAIFILFTLSSQRGRHTHTDTRRHDINGCAQEKKSPNIL